jgi:hypothetical protein
MWCARSWVMIGDQDRDSPVPGRVGVGAAGEPDVVGVVAAGGEDLLPVDDVAISVPYRPRPQRGQVGAGLRLGVPDREVQLACQDPRQEELLLLGGAMRLQRGADGLQGDRRQRHVGPDRLVGEDLLFHLAEPASSVLGRPAQPEPPVAAHPPHDRAVSRVVPVAEHRGALLGRDQR